MRLAPERQSVWHEVRSGGSGQCPAFSIEHHRWPVWSVVLRVHSVGSILPLPTVLWRQGRLAQEALRTEWTAKDSKSLSLKNIYSAVWEESKAEGKHSSLKQHTLQESSLGFKGGGVRVVREKEEEASRQWICPCVWDGWTCL